MNVEQYEDDIKMRLTLADQFGLDVFGYVTKSAREVFDDDISPTFLFDALAFAYANLLAFHEEQEGDFYDDWTHDHAESVGVALTRIRASRKSFLESKRPH